MISETELAKLSFPDAPRIVSGPPGPEGKAIYEKSTRHVHRSQVEHPKR
jgi:hypothetical protein